MIRCHNKRCSKGTGHASAVSTDENISVTVYGVKGKISRCGREAFHDLCFCKHGHIIVNLYSVFFQLLQNLPVMQADAGRFKKFQR